MRVGHVSGVGFMTEEQIPVMRNSCIRQVLNLGSFCSRLRDLKQRGTYPQTRVAPLTPGIVSSFYP
jgi:hypothetical protein